MLLDNNKTPNLKKLTFFLTPKKTLFSHLSVRKKVLHVNYVLRKTKSAQKMYKNQLQELAQRSCFNLPAYTCFREGPDHAPRFRASVNFNGEIFESPFYCSTLRHAEHSAAEAALNSLSNSKCPSKSLTARVLDETGVYKNLLQETAHRAGLNLPVYTTVRSGPGHLPVFTCTVNIATMNFTGLSAKTKKQAEKNAAISAWSSLKTMPNLVSLGHANSDETVVIEDEYVVVSRVLSSFKSVKSWDQNKGRRRMAKGYNKDNSFASSSSSRNSCNFHKPKTMDLVMDSATQTQNQSTLLSSLPSSSSSKNSFNFHQPKTMDLVMDSSSQTQNQSILLSSLPPTQKDGAILSHLPSLPQKQSTLLSHLPPLPKNISNITPPPPLSQPASAKESPPFLYQVGVKPEAKLEKIQPPLKEHQKDEDEWLNGINIDQIKQNPIERKSNYDASSIYRLFPMLNFDEQKLQIRPSISSMATQPIYNGGFNQFKFAQSVQIRSVIPVCSTPPSNPQPILQQEASLSPSPSSSSIALVNTQTAPNQDSLISSNFNKHHLQ